MATEDEEKVLKVLAEAAVEGRLFGSWGLPQFSPEYAAQINSALKRKGWGAYEMGPGLPFEDTGLFEKGPAQELESANYHLLPSVPNVREYAHALWTFNETMGVPSRHDVAEQALATIRETLDGQLPEITLPGGRKYPFIAMSLYDVAVDLHPHSLFSAVRYDDFLECLETIVDVKRLQS